MGPAQAEQAHAVNDQANHSQADIHAAALTFAGKAQEALESATAALAAEVPGRRPDVELASAWALIGQGWATLAMASHGRGPLDHLPGAS